MDGPRYGSQYEPMHSHKHKKIEIYSSHVKQYSNGYHYHEYNPYALSRIPTSPALQRASTTTDRDTYTQSSSQRSAKIIRTNVLNRAQKPNLSQSRTISAQNLANSPTPTPSNHIQPPYLLHPPQRQQSRSPAPPAPPAPPQQPLLISQNRLLAQQNRKLRQQIWNITRVHESEMGVLRQHLSKIVVMMQELQGQVGDCQRELGGFIATSNR